MMRLDSTSEQMIYYPLFKTLCLIFKMSILMNIIKFTLNGDGQIDVYIKRDKIQRINYIEIIVKGCSRLINYLAREFQKKGIFPKYDCKNEKCYVFKI